jgi:restriction system protein
MGKNSLFALLSQSPWWLSLGIAAALFVGLQTFLPGIVAASAALPFAGIAAWAAWKQLRTPSPEKLDALRALSWEAFAPLLAEAFRREGYEVEALGGGADFALRRNGRLALASGRRWKVAQTGVAPLRELVAAGKAREAYECIYIAAGDVTPQAREFAALHRVRLVGDTELSKLMARVKRAHATEKP